EIELLQRHHLIRKVHELRQNLFDIINTYEWGRIFREGAKVCVCGRPNVGKSGLVNALLGTERVIVTPLPGTTRDVIEESLNLDGLPVTIWDTAGIAETIDQGEKIGVDLSRRHLEKADAVLVVLDGSLPITFEDEVVLRSAASKKAMIVVNKNDLPRQNALDALREFPAADELICVSAKTGAGIDELKKNLRELLLDA